MRYLWAAGSHRGRARANNEDRIHPETSGAGPHLVAAVADGMGGHAAGEVAAQIAIDTAVAADADVEHRVRLANAAVFEASVGAPDRAGMGTTLTMGVFDEDGLLHLGHVGDSRAYLLRNGSLEQITRDHSLVNEYIEAGRIRPEDAATHPQRSILTRALGLDPDVDVDVVDVALKAGDRVLFCSDGLSSMVDDATIADLLAAGTPDDAVWALIEAANRAGGLDNVSVVVVDVGP